MVFKKGNIPHNLGKKTSIEIINKIKNSAKNNPDYGMKNKKHKLESLIKMSNAAIGRTHTLEAKRKMSLYRRGLKHSLDWNKKVAIALKNYKKTKEHLNNLYLASLKRKGKTYEEIYGLEKARKIKLKFKRGLENNANWLGGKSFEPYGLEFNKQFKEAIRIRDNNSCMICGSDNRLSIHHIDYNKLNTTKENCILVCTSCHTKTNFNREHWTKFFQSLLSEKYGYDYKIGVILI